MIRKIRFLAMLLALCLGVSGALALSSEMETYIDSFNLSEYERIALVGLVESLGKDMTQEEQRLLIVEFVGELDIQADTLIGYLDGDLYTHPLGFQLVIPLAWSLEEDLEEGVVRVYGEADDQGFMPSITLYLPEGEDALALAQATLESREAFCAPDLEDYQTLSFEEMIHQDVAAWEHVYSYVDESLLGIMTHEFFFAKDELSVLIRMDTRDVGFEPYLDLYDAFLAAFATGV